MIWVRRLLTIPLGLLFLVLLVLTLIVFRLGATFLEPDFYKEQLAKADIYSFLLNELPTSGIEELRAKEPAFFSEDLEENPVVTLGLSTYEIVSSIQTALPPSWLQTQVEQVIDQAGGYITGKRDGFEITIRAAERVKATTGEVERLVHKANLYDLLFDEIVSPKVDEALEGDNLPFSVTLTRDEIISAVQRVVPEEWVKEQVDQALDEVTAYIVGDQDSFEIRVELAQQADVAVTEVKDLLRRANFGELLFDEVVDPFLEGNLTQLTELPFGVTITQEEVKSALRQVAPPQWVEEQVLGVIDEVGPYLTGSSNSFQVVIPLDERREVALGVIGDLADAKLRELIRGLPQCDAGQFPFAGGFPDANELPLCYPPGFDIEELVDSLDIDITGGVDAMIGSQLLDPVTYTQADLRKALSGSEDTTVLEIVDNVREVVSQGWTYTDADLREDLMESQGEDAIETLDDVRDALSGGFTYTDADLREDLADAGDGEVLDNLDKFRDQLGRARSLQYLVYVLWALLLMAIGVLGGRHWWSKVAWAAVVLSVSSAIVFIASGPIYGYVGESRIDELRTEQLQDLEGTQLLAAEKGFDVAQTVADDFLGGIATASLTLLIVAVVILGVALLWPRVSPRLRQSGGSLRKPG
ncbi:MAG: hypothetical protein HYX93_04695 [Chloroflexi bacterium]|nr:hypothetical protein [Chloroflexota bacterium]